MLLRAVSVHDFLNGAVVVARALVAAVHNCPHPCPGGGIAEACVGAVFETCMHDILKVVRQPWLAASVEGMEVSGAAAI